MWIRAATIDDCEAILRVNIDSWRWAYQGIVPSEMLPNAEDLPDRARRMRENWNDEDPRFVVEIEGAIAGYSFGKLACRLADFESEIEALYTHPDVARKGVGKALFNHSEHLFREAGKKNLAIHTLEGNAIGRGFYEKMGGFVVASDLWRDLPAVWYGWPNL